MVLGYKAKGIIIIGGTLSAAVAVKGDRWAAGSRAGISVGPGAV